MIPCYSFRIKFYHAAGGCRPSRFETPASTSSSAAIVHESSLFECSSDKNVAKWNVKFNGTTDPRSFIERIEELQGCYGVSDAKLFRSAAQLFSDQALIWFRGLKHQLR
ncbi:uncharacterized protein LOC123874715 [Maniola jurtina]|uniref:uncharacterized protein LOC123873192 n=1 Tax=Maniola jurtina TaxID=191418 RepID=UPI001E68ADE7|nr:uncharacterized protein LOC123873192 [Maniola jurtina]XP_045776153.1 uncharacterized protein LOC123874715 [Maniola jurtina]